MENVAEPAPSAASASTTPAEVDPAQLGGTPPWAEPMIRATIEASLAPGSAERSRRAMAATSGDENDVPLPLPYELKPFDAVGTSVLTIDSPGASTLTQGP